MISILINFALTLDTINKILAELQNVKGVSYCWLKKNIGLLTNPNLQTFLMYFCNCIHSYSLSYGIVIELQCSSVGNVEPMAWTSFVWGTSCNFISSSTRGLMGLSSNIEQIIYKAPGKHCEEKQFFAIVNENLTALWRRLRILLLWDSLNDYWANLKQKWIH